MNKPNTISVTSHVGRDLLPSAASFRNDAATVWEYVVNSLQYVDPHINPIIQVTIKNRPKVIEISDNGQGMDVDDLNNFFTMHGPNIERLSGRPGRGKFGTGKSAAFGIGKLLRVDSTKDGVRKVTSSYVMKTGKRVAVGDYTTPATPYIASNNYDGQFRGDYHFTKGSGDLDECNGMLVGGQYGYYVTDAYPWVMSCFKGAPDTSFSKRRRR